MQVLIYQRLKNKLKVIENKIKGFETKIKNLHDKLFYLKKINDLQQQGSEDKIKDLQEHLLAFHN